MLRCFTVFTQDLYSLCVYKGVVIFCRWLIIFFDAGVHAMPLGFAYGGVVQRVQ